MGVQGQPGQSDAAGPAEVRRVHQGGRAPHDGGQHDVILHHVRQSQQVDSKHSGDS